MPDAAPIPDDLIALQCAVHQAQRNLNAYTGGDPEEHHRLRRAESQAVLDLYRHPERANVHWKALYEAAIAAEASQQPDDLGQN